MIYNGILVVFSKVGVDDELERIFQTHISRIHVNIKSYKYFQNDKTANDNESEKAFAQSQFWNIPVDSEFLETNECGS